jgi:hypothetical protein
VNNTGPFFLPNPRRSIHFFVKVSHPQYRKPHKVYVGRSTFTFVVYKSFDIHRLLQFSLSTVQHRPTNKMFKLVVLSALLAIAAARPGLLAPTVYSSAIVGSVPTSISHHSSSVVHSAAFAAPVVHAAPLVTAHAAPIVTAHAAPVISTYAAHGAPLIW